MKFLTNLIGKKTPPIGGVLGGGFTAQPASRFTLAVTALSKQPSLADDGAQAISPALARAALGHSDVCKHRHGINPRSVIGQQIVSFCSKLLYPIFEIYNI